MLALSLGLAGMAPNAASAMSSMCKTEWTKTTLRALTADEAYECRPKLSATNISWLLKAQITKFDWNVMQGLSASQTLGWTSAQINQMTADQLKGLIESNELAAAQLSVAQTRYTKLTGTKTAPTTTVKKSPTTTVKKTPPTTAVKKTTPTTAVKTPPTTAVKKSPTTTTGY